MSINLLPQQEKKHRQRLYRLRRLIASSWLVIVLVVVSIIMLTPIYLLSENIELSTLIKNEQLTKEDINIDITEVEKSIHLINKKAFVLQNSKHIKIYKLFSDITENKLAKISITGMAFNNTDEEEIISIVGNADDRETLLSFRRNLEQKEYTESVNLPVSNFAQNSDIDFSIKIILKGQ